MVTRVAHGGHCCGAGHIYGFGMAEEANPDLIDAALAQSPTGRHNNVMLNLTQMRSYPNVLRRLADRGFVLDGHFRNSNHDSHVFSFSRADRREAFTPEALQALGVNWPGMVITDDLHGNLPALPAGAVRPDDDLVVGWRCRVARANHCGFEEVTVGLVGVVVSSMNGVSRMRWEFDDAVRARLDQIHGVGSRAQSNVYSHSLEPLDQEEAPAPPPIPEMRHLRARVVRDNEPTVVATMYANRYRTSGRAHTRYGSYNAAVNNQSARARNATVDRLEILSDGNERWIEGVDE